MKPGEKGRFAELIGNVYGFYGKDASTFAIGVWWDQCKAFDFDALVDALNRHCGNPDSGQYVPKPSDVVKMLSGSTLDSALVAWAKVDKAVRQVGPWQSVAFDDRIVHRVIDDLGGWAKLASGTGTEHDWAFVGKEFQTRYRGYMLRNDVDQAPGIMLGMTATHNAQCGGALPAPVLVGDPELCLTVIAGGSATPRLGLLRLDAEQAMRLTAAEATKVQPKRLR